jgi:hypothetical protein
LLLAQPLLAHESTHHNHVHTSRHASHVLPLFQLLFSTFYR